MVDFRNMREKMASDSAKERIRLFSERFARGDVGGLLELYEDDAVFPTHHGTAKGIDQILTVLQG
jgi:ketosteroid isomerase-like protein